MVAAPRRRFTARLELDGSWRKSFSPSYRCACVLQYFERGSYSALSSNLYLSPQPTNHPPPTPPPTMSSPTTSSSPYIYAPSSPSEIDSLPDSAPSSPISSSSSEPSESDAEKEWKESLQQLELILTMVLVPYAGKYFGRKCAYWGEWVLNFLFFSFLFLWGG